MKLNLLTLIFIFSLTSCLAPQEKLTLTHQVKTVNEMRKDAPILFSYQIDDTQIDEYAKNAGKFPIFGKLFKAVAVVLANSTINNSEGHELELDPLEVDFSSSSKVDFEFIEWIKLNSLLIQIRDSKVKDNLKFVDKIEIWAKLDEPTLGVPVDEMGYTRLLYFDRKIQSLGCSDKCLYLEQESIDWKKLLEENKKLMIKPKIVINSVPLSTMKLAGSVDFSVKFNLKF